MKNLTRINSSLEKKQALDRELDALDDFFLFDKSSISSEKKQQLDKELDALDDFFDKSSSKKSQSVSKKSQSVSKKSQSATKKKHCKGLSREECIKSKDCIFTKGSKRQYCRSKKNKKKG